MNLEQEPQELVAHQGEGKPCSQTSAALRHHVLQGKAKRVNPDRRDPELETLRQLGVIRNTFLAAPATTPVPSCIVSCPSPGLYSILDWRRGQGGSAAWVTTRPPPHLAQGLRPGEDAEKDEINVPIALSAFRDGDQGPSKVTKTELWVTLNEPGNYIHADVLFAGVACKAIF